MDLEKLFALLNIENREEFEYFENFADMIEMDEDIPAGVLYELIEGVPESAMLEMISGYFDDMLENIPDDAELYTLLEMIKRVLSGLASFAREDRNMVLFADEIHRFRNWFKFERQAVCEQTGEKLSVFEAITIYRGDKLENKGEPVFDFENCFDYKPDEYIMSFVDYAREEFETAEGDDTF